MKTYEAPKVLIHQPVQFGTHRPSRGNGGGHGGGHGH